MLLRVEFYCGCETHHLIRRRVVCTSHIEQISRIREIVDVFLQLVIFLSQFVLFLLLLIDLLSQRESLHIWLIIRKICYIGVHLLFLIFFVVLF